MRCAFAHLFFILLFFMKYLQGSLKEAALKGSRGGVEGGVGSGPQAGLRRGARSDPSRQFRDNEWKERWFRDNEWKERGRSRGFYIQYLSLFLSQNASQKYITNIKIQTKIIKLDHFFL
jgi:hypothetical protein